MNLATAIAASPVTSGGVLVTVPLSFSAVRGARRLAARAAVTWDRPDLEDTAELLTSEIVTNAVRHARRRVQLSVVKVDRGMRVSVWDDGPGSPRVREAAPFDTSGRGLILVRQLADAHGALLSDDGSKGIWFQLL